MPYVYWIHQRYRNCILDDDSKHCYQKGWLTKYKCIVLSIRNKKYGYPLLKDEFDDEVEAIKEFNYHCKKIQKEEFKLIRNFESLDSHYQRVFTRVKYGILIL